MTSPDAKTSLLQEIDVRQDQLLAELDQLNARVEALLNECLQARDGERGASEPPLPGSAESRRSAPALRDRGDAADDVDATEDFDSTHDFDVSEDDDLVSVSGDELD